MEAKDGDLEMRAHLARVADSGWRGLQRLWTGNDHAWPNPGTTYRHAGRRYINYAIALANSGSIPHSDG